MRRAGTAAVLGLVLLTTACTATAPRTIDRTVVTTPTVTVSPTDVPGPFTPALTAAAAQPPGSAFPPGEVEGSCPYIRAGLNIEPTPGQVTFADAEGSRVQRVAQLTDLTPVGCRFYFFSDYHPTGDILPTTYSSPVEAHNAMVVTAEAGTAAEGVPNFVPGVDGISFRTTLNAGANGQEWAFAFAKGDVMVVVRTDSPNVSGNARSVAEAIVDKF